MATDASDYPTNADSIPRTNPSDNLTGHSDLHDKMADAIEEIQGFVGVSGDTTAGTIVKRVSDLEAAPPAHDHNDTYYTETEVDTLLAGKQDSGSYAAATHSHSYAATTHTHSYASDTHNHNTLYASTGHTHSYAATSHSHDYAASSHSHDYAASSHGHTNMITGKRGNGSYYVDGNGYATITHGLGSTPVAAFVQTRAQITTGGGGGEVVISLPVTSVTSTGVTFRAYEADAGNNNNSGYVSTIYDTTPGDTYVNVSWLVLS